MKYRNNFETTYRDIICAGSEVYDEEVEANYFETISDEEESYKTCNSPKSIERASLVEGIW